MKFLKTIRFDRSDTHVFKDAAEAGEWAISGAFGFSNLNEDEITGKRKQAFTNGFLSLGSFGYSTFVCVEEISRDEIEALNNQLAEYFVQRYGAPDMDSAIAVAREEIVFVADLCAQAPINSLFAVQRYFDEAKEMREEFTIVDAPGAAPNRRVWGAVEE